jgi:hypothetical protein
MQQLTARVDGLALQMQQLTARVDGLALQMEQLTADIRELARIGGRAEGRLGNLEGWRYEQQFNARARVTDIIRRPVEVNLAELEPVLDARDDGRLDENEWKHLLALDFLFKGRPGKGVSAPERLVALEVSQVVDADDVQRAHDRAGILARVGLETIPVVGGRRLTPEAARLARDLGVRTLIDSLDEA